MYWSNPSFARSCWQALRSSKKGELKFVLSQSDASPDVTFKSLFCTLFYRVIVTGGVHRNHQQSRIIPDHSISVTLVEIRRNFPWMGEQNYLELKHSRSVNNSVLGRKTPRSFISGCEGFGFVSKPNYVFVTEWGCSVWGGNGKFCGIGSIDQKKMLSAAQPVPFPFSPSILIFLIDLIS